MGKMEKYGEKMWESWKDMPKGEND